MCVDQTRQTASLIQRKEDSGEKNQTDRKFRRAEVNRGDGSREASRTAGAPAS